MMTIMTMTRDLGPPSPMMWIIRMIMMMIVIPISVRPQAVAGVGQ